MVRKPPEPPHAPEPFRQRTLENHEDGELRGQLRDLADHGPALIAIAVSRERWAWLRSLLGSTLTWAGIALAFLVALKDEIADWFNGGAV